MGSPRSPLLFIPGGPCRPSKFQDQARVPYRLVYGSWCALHQLLWCLRRRPASGSVVWNSCRHGLSTELFLEHGQNIC